MGSSEKVLERAGKVPAEILMCAIILCIGPMVAIPRTSASTYEMAIAPNLSGVSPVVFSVVFFTVILALCIKESAVVDIVGKVLTPLLLVGLFAIIIKGVITPLGDIAPLAQIDNVAVTGIKAGYQTMDALAALPFGIIVLQSVTAKGYQRGQSQLRVVGGAALLAGVLLLAVYMGLAYLGATVSAQYTSSIGRAALIMAIVEALMGKTGMVIFGVVVGLACVTTAIALTSSAAAYFTELCRGKISYKVFVTVICVFSAVVSNLGLDRIVAVAAPVLDIVYPPTLVLICVSLIIPKVHDFVSRGAALGALLTSVLCTLHTCGVKLPLVEALPLYDLGLSWLLPAAPAKSIKPLPPGGAVLTPRSRPSLPYLLYTDGCLKQSAGGIGLTRAGVCRTINTLLTSKVRLRRKMRHRFCAREAGAVVVSRWRRGFFIWPRILRREVLLWKHGWRSLRSLWKMRTR